MKMTSVVYMLTGFILVIGIILAAITLSVPKAPPVMEAIAAPFRTMNFMTLPPISHYPARDGAKLAYRAYPAAQAKQTVVLIHGSSGSSRSMHALAEYLQKNEMDVYALDMRGHGESGRKGDIDYIGQLEDDLEDFMKQFFQGRKDVTLVGFSSGGGFVLRFAGSHRQHLFGRYIALAPFIRYNAPTTRPNNGEWAKASVPRILALTALGPAGQKWLGHLPVIAYGINPETAQYQTATYSYRLWSNFGLHYDYDDDLKAIKQPLTVLVGEKDELFYPQKYLSVIAEVQPHAEIHIVPEVGHITMTTEPAGMAAIAGVLQHQ
jgi:non-heme chloroperoxidase